MKQTIYIPAMYKFFYLSLHSHGNCLVIYRSSLLTWLNTSNNTTPISVRFSPPFVSFFFFSFLIVAFMTLHFLRYNLLMDN